MSRKKKTAGSKRPASRRRSPKAAEPTVKNSAALQGLLNRFLPEGELFGKDQFHGNVKWVAEQLLAQTLVWSWQETKYVTDAFVHAHEVCEELGMKRVAQSYTSMMNSLNRYRTVFVPTLRAQFQTTAADIGGHHFRNRGWVLIAFDGSRATAPRTVSNERALCAPNYGKGKRAKYGKKKSKGMRRKRNKQNKPHPQAPQAWITMMWHMGMRLPWTWRLGPSNSSERGHVVEMLEEEEFPDKTLFCGDAGFVGYPLWSAIIQGGHNFLVRVGANTKLLSEHADIKKKGGGIVLCWPKGRMDSGDPPLRLRLVQVTVGKTKMWMLTNVLDRKGLSIKHIVIYYKLRWGIEVEFRGLKQTVDKCELRCRNSERLFVELEWSIWGMAVAELFALSEQIPHAHKHDGERYSPKQRSLAETMRALRKCMRNLNSISDPENGPLQWLAAALVKQYDNRTDKRARYRPKNPDKKPLGDPEIREMNSHERRKLNEINASQAA